MQGCLTDLSDGSSRRGLEQRCCLGEIGGMLLAASSRYCVVRKVVTPSWLTRS